MKIAPEGRVFVGAGILMLGVFTMVAARGGSWWWAVVAGWLPIAVWIPWFFRNPDVSGPRGDQFIVAPADGKIVSIAEVDEPTFLRGPARRVSIFMNVFNVHVNRHPTNGVVRHHEYRPGRFLNASLDKASVHNEQMLLGIEGPRGAVLVTQIAGLIARRIVCDPGPEDPVVQGDRLGLIRFGSRVDTFFGRDATLRVELGDRTVAGSTVLAEWPEEVS